MGRPLPIDHLQTQGQSSRARRSPQDVPAQAYVPYEPPQYKMASCLSPKKAQSGHL